MTRHLTPVASTEWAASAPPEGPHPMEAARKALREAAMYERDRFWREHLRRFADALPPRGQG
jgi:hypothetical protein